MRATDDVEVRSSLIHGRGVFTTRRFPAGEKILPIDDSRVVTEDDPLDPEAGELEHHQDYLADRTALMKEPERYINHCCEPNTYVRTLDGVRWVIAYREIGSGEEVTFDYCINSLGSQDEEWKCACGHPKCRGTHNTDFFSLPAAKLAEYLPLLDDWFIERTRDRVEEARLRLDALHG